jgi:NADPH2:quinone reductase
MKVTEGRMRAIVVEALGGPEVLQVHEVDRPSARPDEVLIQVDRAGINYSDIGRRRNGWQNPPQTLPVIPGLRSSAGA